MKETIKTFGGKSLGTITTDSKGNSVARNFGGKILGSHSNSSNTVREFGGKSIGTGKGLLGSFFK